MYYNVMTLHQVNVLEGSGTLSRKECYLILKNEKLFLLLIILIFAVFFLFEISFLLWLSLYLNNMTGKFTV